MSKAKLLTPTTRMMKSKMWTLKCHCEPRYLPAGLKWQSWLIPLGGTPTRRVEGILWSRRYHAHARGSP